MYCAEQVELAVASASPGNPANDLPERAGEEPAAKKERASRGTSSREGSTSNLLRKPMQIKGKEEMTRNVALEGEGSRTVSIGLTFPANRKAHSLPF